MFKEKLTLQEYLSLGYIYLIVLGIISDVIYFRFLDVDILNYSAISDILLSPVNILTQSWLLFIFFVGVIIFSHFYINVFMPKFHKKYRNKKWYSISKSVEKSDKTIESIKKNKGLPFMLFFIFCMFVGLGIGRGTSVRKRIKNQDLKINHRVTFINDFKKDVYVVGQNSSYLFYILEGEKEVSITAINPNIKVIQKLNKE
ncbi:hypothetical protein WAF17_19965 [Bernardetia sp. ABR2-2B]|uniref:hypothetical protein n=1 Tax=Bernardetia sp. ABR2-2B TaxID=3127472 RepID=UPI0030D269E7